MLSKEKTQSKSGITKVLFLILIIIAMALLVRFAWARYQSSINGNGIADVAHWNFKLTNGVSQTENITNFAITRAKNDTDSVAEGMLAPGTNGEFVIGIDAARNTDITRIWYRYKFEK